jgi:pyruvate/2-oxoglutarate dehydrogenase complex dihydrolipoamide acyltransferase (E2) component
MAYVALKHLKWGDEWIAPGEPVPEEEGRNYGLLLRTKRIAKVLDGAAMDHAEIADALQQAHAARDAALERVAELEAASPVEVPDEVTPGETPGWPVDAVTGGPLALSEEQREGLAGDGISGEAVLTHRGEIIAITAEEGEGEGAPEVDATDSAVQLAKAHGIDLSQVEGTGQDGRVTQPDVQKAIDAATGA